MIYYKYKETRKQISRDTDKENKTMARKLYEELKELARNTEDRENSKLYVSDTISKRTKNAVGEMVKKSIEMILVDLELGIITEQNSD